MRCLSKLGTNVVIQDEANDAQWAGLGGAGAWQPLEWMGSSWRDVTDKGVGIDYNVTPFMVGNLADLVFDGQSSIAQRPKAKGRGCNYVGNRHFMPGPPENDPGEFKPYAGRKKQFLGLARWVVPGTNDRDRLRAAAADLAPGSGSPIENRLPRDRGGRRPAVPARQAPPGVLARQAGRRPDRGQLGQRAPGKGVAGSGPLSRPQTTNPRGGGAEKAQRGCPEIRMCGEPDRRTVL